MRTDDGNQVLAIVRLHIGRNEAIGSRAICRALGWRPGRERYVRRLIADQAHLWSADGVLVCAVPGNSAGYFVAESFDEAETYRNWLAALAKVANRKLFNFRDACSKLGIRFVGAKS